MSGEAASSARVADEAVEWTLLHREGALDDDGRARFEHWMQADAAHAAAFNKLQGVLAAVDRPRQLGVNLQPVLDKVHALQSRRKAARRLAVAGLSVGGGGLWLANQQTALLELGADLRTATAERKRFSLPDASAVTLNARSAVDVMFSRDERGLRLRSGAVVADVVTNLARPFRIHTPMGAVTALGTSFAVSLGQDAVRVSVAHSRVLVQNAVGTTREVAAGEVLSFSAGSMGRVMLGAGDEMSWLQGYLVAFDRPLIEVIDSLRPYVRGSIQVAPSVASLRVSGTLQLDAPDLALQALANGLPIKVVHLPFWTRIGPRET